MIWNGDVITFEASRSDLAILDDLKACGFRTQVGPGVYQGRGRNPSLKNLVKAVAAVREGL